nr:immunoglobulin heavy chain junction region [Macaca mulatta]
CTRGELEHPGDFDSW